jgi:hypothetical protein
MNSMDFKYEILLKLLNCIYFKVLQTRCIILLYIMKTHSRIFNVKPCHVI